MLSAQTDSVNSFVLAVLEWDGGDSPLPGRVAVPPFSTRIGVMGMRARLPGGGGGIAGAHGQAGTLYRLSPGGPGAAEELHLQLWLQHRSAQTKYDEQRAVFVHHILGKDFSLPVRAAGGLGTAVPVLAPLWQREQSRITAVHAQRLNLFCFMVQLPQGTPGLCEDALEREVPARGVPYGGDQKHFLGFLNLLRCFEDCRASSSVSCLSCVSLKYFCSSFILFTHGFKDLEHSSCTAWDQHMSNCF